MTMISEDFKYVMQDISKVYIGASASYEELMEMNDVPFKFKAIISHYLLKEVNAQITLAQHVLELDANSFAYLTLNQLKINIKCTIINGFVGRGGKKKNRNKTMTLKEFVTELSHEEKAEMVFVEEVIISKLSLISFSV